MEGEDSLAENSPNLDLKQAQKKRRRGQALRFASIANSSGVGGMPSPPSNYPKMMSDLARRQLLTLSGSKVDIVFVIDKTGSMVDNVRGVRAYIDHFFDLYDREGYDIAVGLVTFADLENHKIKWHGVTDNRRKFKKWLQKIDFEGGGDLTESGLDALMEAIYKIKYRELTQRIFVMVSDGVFHDADYNGRSEYSQDQVIASLKEYSIRVDVIGGDDSTSTTGFENMTQIAITRKYWAFSTDGNSTYENAEFNWTDKAQNYYVP